MHEHHPDAIEKNIDTHPVKLAIGIATGAIALIVGIIMLVNLAMGAYAGRSMKDDPAMSDAAVAKRIAPVARLAIDPNAPAKAPEAKAAATAPGAMAAVAIPPPPAKGAAGADGKQVYDSACSACHASGVAGAPKLGDKAAWAPRAKQGKDALYASVLNGKGAMPPKGGNTSLSDAAVKAGVDYMVSAAK